MEKVFKVIICGSRFGQFYFEALRKLGGDFTISGLLAQGSKRSARCADIYGVPLYTRFEDLPSDIDLACIVVKSSVFGGAGTELAMKFLEKGISVIQEQPVHYKDIAQCFKLAKKRGVVYHICDLYPNLTAVTGFMDKVRILAKKQEITYIEASCTTQVSYPLMDVLSYLPSLSAPILKLTQPIIKVGTYQLAIGKFGQYPILIKADNRFDPHSPDNCLPLLHQISVCSDAGILSLPDTHGPVIWKPALNFPEADILPELLKTNPAGLMNEENISVLKKTGGSYKKLLLEDWPGAIGKDLLFVKQAVNGEKSKDQLYGNLQRILMCSQQWQELMKVMGFPELKSNKKYSFIAKSDFEGEVVL